MVNLQDVLGKMLEAGVTPSQNDRVRNALGSQTGNTGGDTLGGLMDAFKTIDSGQILDNLSGGAKDAYGRVKEGVQGGDPLAIGGLAALAGAILGGGRSALTGAVGAGALAILGKIAFEALQKQKAAQTGTPAAASTGHSPAAAAPVADPGLILDAMINAAKADGTVDKGEQDKIMNRLQQAGADPEMIRFVNDKMQAPADLDGLIRAVPDEATGLQVYTASLLAMEVDTQEEKAYLQRLASGLGLDPAAVAHVHGALGVRI